MTHFSRFYDALLDSTQLRNDLATKIHKANELVAAHQIELRKVENLRGEFEAALKDFEAKKKRMIGVTGEGEASGDGEVEKAGAVDVEMTS